MRLYNTQLREQFVRSFGRPRFSQLSDRLLDVRIRNLDWSYGDHEEIVEDMFEKTNPKGQIGPKRVNCCENCCGTLQEVRLQ